MKAVLLSVKEQLDIIALDLCNRSIEDTKTEKCYFWVVTPYLDDRKLRSTSNLYNRYDRVNA